MIRDLKNSCWKCITSMDTKLKFPNLKKGEIGVQLGFDMAYPLTSDLFSMYKKVKPNGLVIGIDPDPFNHQIAQQIIDKNNFNINLIQKGTYSKKDVTWLLIGEKSSWNQLKNIAKDSTVAFTEKEIDVNIDQLDAIIGDLNIDFQKISHINLTINGAEYETLLGMNKILSEIKNLSLTIIAGRYDESGTINGKQDFEMILPLLHSYGFTTKFKRIHQLFWWGFVVKLFLNRKWIYSQRNFGIIMACKGKHQLKWYQSFS